MISKSNKVLITLASALLLSSAQQLFMHEDHVHEGIYLGEAPTKIPMEELMQFKC
jgi:hypothetical protein